MVELGLFQKDLDTIVTVLQNFNDVEQAIIFGSRAKGNYRHGSDVDIALKGIHLNLHIISRVSYQLNEETTLPYRFDVLNYQTISNKELKEHIDRVGVTIYLKSESSTRIILPI